ncbi:hypothetical protein [Enterococcus hirae]|nr:hypothetical protein [Enterococcus hirae]
MFKKTKSLESGKKKSDLKIISSGYFKDFIVIGAKWNKKDIENILNSRNN